MKNFLALLGLLVLIGIAGLFFLIVRNRAQPAAPEPIAQPTIKISWPPNGARVRVGQAFQVHAVANDAQAIQYAIDGGAVTPIPNASAAIPITLASKGVHTIAVQAIGATGKSEPAAIKVVAVNSLSDPVNPNDPPVPAPPASDPAPNPVDPQPGPNNATVQFAANPATIQASQCSTLRWDVANVREIYFEGVGVTGHEARQQCPAQTTTFVLHVVFLDASARDYPATVTVSAVNNPAVSAPTNLRVTSTTKTSARIAWDDRSNNETGFEIEIEGRQNPKTNANETQFEITGLTCNRAYNLRVRAFNATGASAFSNQVTAQTLACDGGSTFAVTHAAISVNRATYIGPCPNTFTAGAKITASGAGTVRYRWERSDGQATDARTIQFDAAGEKTITNIDWQIASSGNYWMLLHVLEPNDLKSNKGETAWTCANAHAQPPAAPTNLKIAGWSSSTLTLEWTDNSNNEASFELQRVTNESVGVLATVGAGTNKATVNKPPCGVAYAYRVVAKNSAGDSQPSNVLTVPAEACAPTPKPLVITGVKVTITPENFSGPCPYRVNYAGTISASAAGKVKYQWILDGEAHPARELVFDGAGTKSVEVGTWTVKTGTHTARLKILEPIDIWMEDKIGVFCSP